MRSFVLACVFIVSCGGKAEGEDVPGVPPSGGAGGAFQAQGGAGASAGAGGVGGRCGLPLDGGSCLQVHPSFGFHPLAGRCESFIYGGCDGNENRFSSLVDCEAACGGNVAACPGQQPAGSCQEEPDVVCSYTPYGGCLCVPDRRSCMKLVSSCVDGFVDPLPPDEEPCVGDDCTAFVPAVATIECRCKSGSWNCEAQYVR